MSETRKPFETYAHYKIGKGFATLAVSVDNLNASVGISYCHPRDGINKSYGRNVARARREAGSTFGFDFQRNRQTLGAQLRDEFERFVIEAGTQRARIGQLINDGVLREEDAIRVGAPPWVIHSLNREIRKRENLIRCLDVDFAADCGC